MKKIAFFVALFVGLNSGFIVRKSDDEVACAIVTKYTPKKSMAYWISRIASILKTSYYGISKNGDIHEICLEYMPVNNENELNNAFETEKKNRISQLPKAKKPNIIWFQMNYELQNKNESWELNLLEKNSNQWELKSGNIKF
jgi:hypothetical protein